MVSASIPPSLAAELARLSYSALRERKVRSAIVITMVVIGVTLITGLNAMMKGVQAYMDQQFSNLAPNVIMVFSSRREVFSLTPSICQSMATVNGVKAVVPFISRSATVTVAGSSKSVVVMGIDQTKLNMVFPTATLLQGEYVAPQDTIGVLVGHSVAYSPSEDQLVIQPNQTITLTYVSLKGSSPKEIKKSFVVRGILNPVGAGGALSPDRMVFVSLSSACAIYGTNTYDGAFVVAESADVVDQVVAELTTRYPYMEVIVYKNLINAIKNVISAYQGLMQSVATVSLIVAGVGIFASLYTSVLERTREIGLLKALGFKNSYVLFLFLCEALLIGAIGGFLGDVAGVGLAHLLAYLQGIRRASTSSALQKAISGVRIAQIGYIAPAITPEVLFSSWLYSVFVSIVAGLYPAWRASKLDPVVALRKE